MSTGDFTTLATVKQFKGITSSNDDALLTRLISEASQFINTWLSRNILQEAYTEIISGTGKPFILTKQYPIVSIELLKIDGREIPASPDGKGFGYVFDDNLIALRHCYATKNLLNIDLAYTAGFAVVPPDIEQACIDMVMNAYVAKDRIGINSKSLAGENVSFFRGALTERTQTLLNQYRSVVTP